MKKLICLLLAASFALSGCGNADTAEEARNDTDTVNGITEPGVYNMSDFAIYTIDEDNYPSKVVAVIGVDPTTVKYDDEAAEIASKGVTMENGEVNILNDKGEIEKQTLIKSFNVDGSRIPVTNPKGIKTTGLYTDDSDDNCSKAENVIKAYEIDEDEEEYKTNEDADGSYTIDLYFTAADSNGSIERIISAKGTDLSKVVAAYGMRFYIRNGYVHGIYCTML